MRMRLNGLVATLRAGRRDTSGVALIEFAFALPLLLTIAMVGIETARIAVTLLRLNQIAMMAADNAARVRSSMDEADVNELMTGIRFIGTGIDLGENGRVIISTLESNGQTGTNVGNKITWQRCYGAKNVISSYGLEGAGTNDASLQQGIGPTGKNVRPVANSALILAEIRYDYKPLVASAFVGGFEMHAIQSFAVRERAQQALTNTKSLSNAQLRLCDAQHLSAA